MKPFPALMQQLERLRPFVGTRFIGCDVSPCLFELLCRVRGMEQAIEDLALQPEVSASLVRAGHGVRHRPGRCGVRDAPAGLALDG